MGFCVMKTLSNYSGLSEWKGKVLSCFMIKSVFNINKGVCVCNNCVGAVMCMCGNGSFGLSVKVPALGVILGGSRFLVDV